MRELLGQLNITSRYFLYNNYSKAITLLCIVMIGLFFLSEQVILIMVSFIFVIVILVSSVIYPVVAIGILLIIAPLRTLVATEAPFFPLVDMGQAYLMVVALSSGLWTLQRRPYFKNVYPSLLIVTLLFLCTLMFSSLFAFSITSWFKEIIKWLEILAVSFIIYISVNSDDWIGLINALFLAGLCNGMIGIYEFFGGSGADHLVVNEQYFRAFGTFGQPNPFGAFMGILSPLALSLSLSGFPFFYNLWRTKKLYLNRFIMLLFHVASFIIFSLALIMSWSRGAWLGFIASSVVVISLYPRKFIHRIWLIGVGLSALWLIFVMGLIPTSISQRLASVFNEGLSLQDVRGVEITIENYAVVERLAHWQVAVRMAEHSPLVGIGFGNYDSGYPLFQLINWHEPLGHAHNYYLNILAEAGLIGLLGYLIWWGSIIYQTLKTIKHPNYIKRSLALGLLGTWVYILIHSLTDNLYVNNLFLHIAVLLGILMILSKQVNYFYRFELNEC